MLPLLPLLVAALVAPAHAQLIGPIPPAAAPAPEYVPKPAGAIPEVKPPPSEPEAPTIDDRDGDGRLRPLATSPEETAVVRYPFDDARRKKIESSLRARSLDFDRFVVANIDKVLEAEALAPRVHAASDFDTLFKARDAVGALKYERLFDRLLRDNAISLEHKTRLEEAVRGYETARKKQFDADAAGDPARAAVLNLRQTFDDVTREPFASLERQLADLAGHAESVLDHVALRDNQQKAAEALRTALMRISPNTPSAPAARREVVRTFWLDILDPEQKRAALTAGRALAHPEPH